MGGLAMASAYCPDCDGKIVLNLVKLGQKMTCPHCDTQLEVISVDPLELDWAYDWSDEEWDEEEEKDEW
jgi:lysine biosynthesis protein LysW